MANPYVSYRGNVYPPRSTQHRTNSDHYSTILDTDNRSGSSYERPSSVHRPGSGIYKGSHIGGRSPFIWAPSANKMNGFSDPTRMSSNHMAPDYSPNTPDTSENGDERVGDSSGSPSKGISRLFSKYADKCSLNGVPFIKLSKNPLVKAVWSLLLLCATGAMTFHLYLLFSTYFEYQTHSDVKLTFSKLQFPAVTICNVNAMRLSQLNEPNISSELVSLIENLQPEKLELLAKEWTPTYEDGEEDYDDVDISVDNEESENDEDKEDDEDEKEDNEPERKKREALNSSAQPATQSSTRRNNNFFDEFSYSSLVNISSRQANVDEVFDEDYSDTWDSEAETSSSSELTDYFYELLLSESPQTRAKLGHQIYDMLLQCSFAGRTCRQSNFTRRLSSTYGNCFTLEYNKFVSRRSGPRYGLELMLYLETDEYITGITQGKGAQVVIHEQGTMPFPEDEGMAVAAGSQTYIGIRQIEISNLGDPYDKCISTADFKKKYGVIYTRNTCQRICEQNRIRKNCKCYDEFSPEINKLLKVPSSLRPCRSSAEIRCLTKVSSEFQVSTDSCGCERPCSEKKYQSTLSSREWPSLDYAEVMINVLCRDLSIEACDKLEQKSAEDKKREFIKLNIYYEDLNYEILDEQPDYQLSQFLSDFGGTLGLWIGLSVLSVFEIFHLLTDIVLFICYGKWRKEKDVSTNGKKNRY